LPLRRSESFDHIKRIDGTTCLHVFEPPINGLMELRSLLVIEVVAAASKHGDRAVRLTPVRVPQNRGRRYGSAEGRVHMARDFDELLTDFAEYS
jgi:hypothetical protein